MEKMSFSILIDASKEKVWNTMLSDATYRQWTEPFSAGSHFEGNWNEGSKILFLGPDGNGNIGGMVSKIKENRLHEFISIQHLGFYHNGVEDTESEKVKEWAGACENYTFISENGKTKLFVETDSNEELKAMFENVWPVALQKLKELSEN